MAQKGITQAYEIQRRLKVWRPRTAAVMGTGTLGLLAALVLRLRGLEVTAFGRTPEPYLNARLLEAIGAAYVNTAERSITDAVKQSGRFDLIFEGTGSSAVVFESMQAVAKNGSETDSRSEKRRKNPLLPRLMVRRAYAWGPSSSAARTYHPFMRASRASKNGG